jgi:hypothetical protein
MILDEANRLYDRLLKYFTVSIMHNAAYASSSSSTSTLGPFDQSDTYRNEEIESHYNSKGDIVN